MKTRQHENKALIQFIKKNKKKLHDAVISRGYCENLGQSELRAARDMIRCDYYAEDCALCENFENFIDSL